jgi:hypothetical protein
LRDRLHGALAVLPESLLHGRRRGRQHAIHDDATSRA